MESKVHAWINEETNSITQPRQVGNKTTRYIYIYYIIYICKKILLAVFSNINKWHAKYLEQEGSRKHVGWMWKLG